MGGSNRVCVPGLGLQMYINEYIYINLIHGVNA